MAASMKQNNSDEVLLNSGSKSIAINETPKSNKRPLPDSPNDLPATQMQEGRQIRRHNSVGDLREGDQKTTKPPVQRKNVTDKVIDALTSTDVLDKIMPVLTHKITETIVSVIESSMQSCVDSNIKPLIETVKRQQITINEQPEVIDGHSKQLTEQSDKITKLEQKVLEQGRSKKEQDAEINALFNKISELEIRVENQEQYSRRTSLRFHNIKVPVDQRGKIIHPVDTDDLVLQVCNTKLGLDIIKTDIGRSHVIGKVNKGKSQVIVRFLSYRTRNSVYTNKKSLKGDQDGVFITENLTKYRTELVKRLSQLKFHRQIYTYWTSDGRIYVKKLETSRKQLVTNFDDIENIECSVHEQTASQTSDTEIYH